MSYLIVDQAEEDVETSQISWDFLEAGPFRPEGKQYWRDKKNQEKGDQNETKQNEENLSSPVTIEISSDTIQLVPIEPNSASE